MAYFQRQWEVQPTSFTNKTFLSNKIILETLHDLWNSQFEYYNLSVWRVAYKDEYALLNNSPRYRLDVDYFWRLNSVLGYVSQLPFKNDLRFSNYVRSVADLLNYNIQLQDNIFDYLNSDERIVNDSWFGNITNNEPLTDDQLERSIYNRCQRILVDLVNKLNQWKSFKGSERLMEFVIQSFNQLNSDELSQFDNPIFVTLSHWFTTDYDIWETKQTSNTTNSDGLILSDFEWRSIQFYPPVIGNKNKDWDLDEVEYKKYEIDRDIIERRQMTPTPHSLVKIHILDRDLNNLTEIIRTRWDYDNWGVTEQNEVSRLSRPIFDIILPMWHTVNYTTILPPTKSKGTNIITALPDVNNMNYSDLNSDIGLFDYNSNETEINNSVQIYNNEVSNGDYLVSDFNSLLSKVIQNPGNNFVTHLPNGDFNTPLTFNSFSTILTNMWQVE